MSTRMRIAYLGSCSNVRSDPSWTSRRSRHSATGAEPPWTRRSGMPSTRVSPTAHAIATTAPSRPASATRPFTSMAWITAGPPRCRTTCLSAGSCVGRRPASSFPPSPSGDVVPLDDLPPPVAGVGEDARDLEHHELLHQQHEEDDAHQQQDEREPDGQHRHLAGAAAVDPGEGGQRVDERRGEDAERVGHHGRPREPRDQAGRVGGGAELHHHEGQGEDEAGEGQHPRGDGGEEGDRRPGADRGREVRKEGGLVAGQRHAEHHRARGVEERRADRAQVLVRLRADGVHGATSRSTPRRSLGGARTGRRAYIRGRSVHDAFLRPALIRTTRDRGRGACATLVSATTAPSWRASWAASGPSRASRCSCRSSSEARGGGR